MLASHDIFSDSSFSIRRQRLCIVDPGKRIPLGFEAYLPDGYTESTDVLKVFATQTTNFRWIELPALDQPDTRSAATRSVITDPLERCWPISPSKVRPAPSAF